MEYLTRLHSKTQPREISVKSVEFFFGDSVRREQTAGAPIHGYYSSKSAAKGDLSIFG